ncbi:MAG TPA: pantoate--beta-alanine ligase [Microthrixaceae bacterium]|nr:pantoate--beta-alanine ligase [Microthrixaceae bacterium]HNI35158.1 pantoate--beta-alanine ligase [Microthrixaceae bacterium]
MQTTTTVEGLRGVLDAARVRGESVGFVPTMGYLHAGHESLMDRARSDCGVVVASIFVNPLQFGVGEDLDAYPRDLDGDSALATRAGVDVLFVPSVEEMYPGSVATTVSVAGVSAPMEGASRPTHFDGVATVVAKLFNIVGPCRAYFGEKDFQQLAVIRRMVADLSVPVTVVGCPTLREDDGLARSSRNVYLSPEERAAAPVLHRALCLGASLIRAGETDADTVRAAMAAEIATQALGTLDYVEVADATTLERQRECGPDSRLLGAVRFGRARLIDNVGVEPLDNVVRPPERD